MTAGCEADGFENGNERREREEKSVVVKDFEVATHLAKKELVYYTLLRSQK